MTQVLIDKLPFEVSGESLGAALSDIGAEIVLQSSTAQNQGGLTTLVLELHNADVNTALADFALLGRTHKDGGWHTLLSASGWDAVAGILRHKVGTLKTLAAASRGMAYVDIGPLYSVKFQASTGGATILSNGTFTGNANDWTLGAGWAYETNTVVATTASATLRQALADMTSSWLDGHVYEVSFTITGHDAGSMTVGTNADPAQGGLVVDDDGTYTVLVTADDHADGLVFTPTGFTGVIDGVTAKKVLTGVTVRGQLFR